MVDFYKKLEELKRKRAREAKHYFTFDDLVFEPHETFLAVQRTFKPGDTLYECYKDSKHAVLYFPNGYGISVITGQVAYATPNHYEVCAMQDGGPVFPIWNDTLMNQTKEQVTQAMKELQDL